MSAPAPDDIATRDDLRAALSTLRLRADLTVRELARRAGLPTATVSDYITARHLPSAGQSPAFRAIVTACGVVDPDEQQRWLAALDRVRLTSDGRSAPRAGSGPAPYLGLEPFQPEDAELYFGRDDAIALILARLTELVEARAAAAPAPQRTLLLLGASGSGKSSLLRAGVCPAVRAGALARVDGAAWSVAIMTPGTDPLDALAEAIGSVPEPRLLIVDQFEELFSGASDPGQSGRFAAAVDALGPHTLLVAGLRADFYPAASSVPELIPVLQDWQIVIPPMSADEVRAVIIEPARLRDTSVEPDLVDTLVAEVMPRYGTGGQVPAHALPLLSHALRSAWQHRRRGPLRLADYRAVGGFAGAVQRSAEDGYAGLTPERQELARRIFLRLVAVDDDLVTTRRRVRRSELAALGDIDSVIEPFVVRRLLTVDDATVDISHEALLSAWPRLAEWVAADHAGLRVHRQLTAAANGWHDDGRDPQALLTGTRLGAVEEWVRDPDHQADLNRVEDEFVRASVGARSAARRTARRHRMRLRALLAVLACLAAGLGVVTGIAVHNRSVADRQRGAARQARDQALSREVAVEATQAAAGNPALAQQLALTAYTIAPTLQAGSALLDTSAGGVLSRLVGQPGPTAATLNPAGTVLAVSDDVHGIVRLYRLAGGHPQAPLATIPSPGGGNQIFALAWSPDGTLLAAGGSDGVVRVYSVADPGRPRLRAAAAQHLTGVESLAFDPAGTRLAAGGQAVKAGDPLLTWSVAAAGRLRPVAVAAESPTQIQTVAYTPDGRLLTGDELGVLSLWPVRPASPARPQRVQLANSIVSGLAVAPDGASVLAGQHNGVTTQLSLAAHALGARHRLGTDLTSWVNNIAFDRQGTLVSVVGSDGHVDLLAARTGTLLWSRRLATQVTAGVFTPDARALLTADTTGTVTTWSTAVAQLAVPGKVFSLVYDRAGDRLFAGYLGGAGVWATTGATLRQVARVPLPAGFVPSGTGAITPNGRLIALGDEHGRVLLARLTASGAIAGTPRVIDRGTQLVEYVAFSPDGRVLAAGGDDGLIRRFDVRDPADPRRLPTLDARGQVLMFAFSPNGRYLAAAAGKAVPVWQVSDPAHAVAVPTAISSAAQYFSVAFRADSNVLAVGADDDTVRLWNARDLAHPTPVGAPLTGINHDPYAVAFSPNGQLLSAVVGDGHVYLWSVRTPSAPQLIATPASLGASGFSVVFSPTGNTVAAGGGDPGQVVLFAVDPAAVAREVCASGGTQLTPAEWRDYVPGTGYRRVCQAR